MIRGAAVATAALLAAAACAGGDDTAPTTTTTTTTTTTEPAPEGGRYPDHVADLYAGTANWICHPELVDDVCRDLRTTVIAADGSRTVEELEPAADPAFDCFYVYPTSSADAGLQSDLVVDGEDDVTRAQVARFASVCRVFAPVYRSITVSGIFQGGFTDDRRAVAYADVLDAWRTYVDDLNGGRGVVLVGHSQGSFHLRQLLIDEVDRDPALQELLVSAVLLGAPVGEDDLDDIAPCTSADDHGCLISFSSYRADRPPEDGAFFGRADDDAGAAVCVDPVALADGDGLARAVLTTSGFGGEFGAIDTPFFALPGAFRTSCATAGDYTYLAVGPSGVEDARPVDGLLEEHLGPAWGLHLLDAFVAQDDLIDVVTQQADAHAAQR